MPRSQLTSMLRAIAHGLRMETDGNVNPDVELETVSLVNDVTGRGSYAPVARLAATAPIDLVQVVRIDVAGDQLTDTPLVLLDGSQPGISDWRIYSHVQVRLTGGGEPIIQVTVAFEDSVTGSVMQIHSDDVPNPGLLILTDVRVPPGYALRLTTVDLGIAGDDVNYQVLGQWGPPGTSFLGSG